MNLLLLAQTTPANPAAPQPAPAQPSGGAGGSDSVVHEAAKKVTENIDKAKDWVTDMTNYVLKLLTEYGFKVLGAIVVMIIAYIIAGWAKKATKAALDRAHFDPTISKFASNVARYVVLVLGLLTCAPILGMPVTAFATILGASGLAIGLASQGALSNLAAGLMLLATRPFKVGDMIVVDGVSGIVEEIELFTTKLNTPDNRRIFMPNNSIFGKVIENSTHNPQRSTTFFISVAADCDIEKVRGVLRKAAESCQLVLKDPGPGIMLNDIDGVSLKWAITVWAQTPTLGGARDQAIRAVRDAIAAAGIKGPTPVTTVRVLERA